MKDKILFWIDPDFLQFGIAKFLQKKIEADFYAIVDLNHHLEKSFKTQKIVNFKQIWYYWENFRKNKPNPNLKYLKDFEQRYNLKLWTLIYSERIFYKYNEFYKRDYKKVNLYSKLTFITYLNGQFTWALL